MELSKYADTSRCPTLPSKYNKYIKKEDKATQFVEKFVLLQKLC